MDACSTDPTPTRFDPTKWFPFGAAIVAICLAACAGPPPLGPLAYEVTPERVARASCDSPYDHCAPAPEDQAEFCRRARALAENASTSLIVFNQRGSYTPVSFILPNECEPEPIRQPTPGVTCDPQPEGPLAEMFTDCMVEYVKQIRSRIASPPPGKRYHLLVFIHGGLNLQSSGLERAFVDANRMLADESIRETTGEAQTGLADGDLVPAVHHLAVQRLRELRRPTEELQPGRLRERVQAFREPPLLADRRDRERRPRPGGLGRRLLLGRTSNGGNDERCALSRGRRRHVSCVPLRGRDDRATSDKIWYWSPIGMAGRLISVPVVDAVGQPAWDAMVSRTRMLMRKPINAVAFAAAGGRLDYRGDLWYLFNVISELPEEARPAITLIGHSMGAIVVNEILRSFPDLPSRNIVYMGAAASIRDTFTALDLASRANPRLSLRFYNLSLHPAAEANEVAYFGTVSKGSLLEWVDRMYTTPATYADRTVGKWINAVMAYQDFLPLESRLQMSFKRFGLSCAEPLKHGEFDEYEPRPGCPEPRTPYWHPAFWTVPEASPRG